MADYPKYIVVFVEQGDTVEIQYECDDKTAWNNINDPDDFYESYDPDRKQVTVLYKAVEVAKIVGTPRVKKSKAE